MSDLAALAGMIEKTIKLIPYEAPPKRSEFVSDEDYVLAKRIYTSERPLKEYVLRSPTVYSIMAAEEKLGIELMTGTYVPADPSVRYTHRKRVQSWRLNYAWLWVLALENEDWEEDFPDLDSLAKSVPMRIDENLGTTFGEIVAMLPELLGTSGSEGDAEDQGEVEAAVEDSFRPGAEVREDVGDDQPGVRDDLGAGVQPAGAADSDDR